MTPIHDPSQCKLGKAPAKPPHRMLASYLDIEKALPQAPAVVDNSKGGQIPLAMYLNDRYGCCTCAAVGNTLRVNSAGAKQLPDQAILAGYEAVTAKEGAAFSPGPPPVNDNGAVELDVLDLWATAGNPFGDVLEGHAGVDMTNLDEVRVALWLFGSIYIGLQLATEQQSQEVWDYVPSSQPGSWGGHAVPQFALDASNPQQITGLVGTWGAYKKVTGAFLTKQADEGHVPITDAWLAANQANPLVSAQALAADLSSFKAES